MYEMFENKSENYFRVNMLQYKKEIKNAVSHFCVERVINFDSR